VQERAPTCLASTATETSLKSHRRRANVTRLRLSIMYKADLRRSFSVPERACSVTCWCTCLPHTTSSKQCPMSNQFHSNHISPKCILFFGGLLGHLHWKHSACSEHTVACMLMLKIATIAQEGVMADLNYAVHKVCSGLVRARFAGGHMV
jgi:hypothetical protein